MVNATLSAALYVMYGVTALFLVIATFKIYTIFLTLKGQKPHKTLPLTIDSAGEENSKIDIQSVYLEILELQNAIKNQNILPHDSISQFSPQNVADIPNIRLRRVK